MGVSYWLPRTEKTCAGNQGIACRGKGEGRHVATGAATSSRVKNPDCPVPCTCSETLSVLLSLSESQFLHQGNEDDDSTVESCKDEIR